LLPLRPRDVGDTLDVDPFTPVSTFCSTSLTAVAPDTSLRDVLPLFQQFTGLPVVDASGYPVGVVSDKDVAAFLQAGSHTMDTPVSSVMSSPAITILDHSPLAYAAGKMLQFRIHRLVVVDGEGKATAMLTRSDVFQPLVPDVRKSDTTYVAKMEIMAAQAKATGTAASSRLLRTLEKVKDEAKAPRSPWG